MDLLQLDRGVHRRQVDASAPLAWGVISLALLLVVVGFIMHVLTSQMLRPQAWKEWYAPGGVIDPSGAGIHAFNLGRYGFIMALALSGPEVFYSSTSHRYMGPNTWDGMFGRAVGWAKRSAPIDVNWRRRHAGGDGGRGCRPAFSASDLPR